MEMIFIDSKIEHLKEIEHEQVSLDFNVETGEIYIHTLKSEKHIKLSSNAEINTIGRYVIVSDNESLFIMKDLDME